MRSGRCQASTAPQTGASRPVRPTQRARQSLDQGSSDTTISGNVIANTANAITDSQKIGATVAIQFNQSKNVTMSANVIDLGTSAQIAELDYATAGTNADYGPSAMTGNSFVSNVIVGKWAGAQSSYGYGVGPAAYGVVGNPASRIPTNNLYFNYGGRSMSTASIRRSRVPPTRSRATAPCTPRRSSSRTSPAAGLPAL